MGEVTPTDATTSDTLLLDIASAFVGIHKEFWGRGPTGARAHVSRNMVVVLLEGGYSQAEQTLHEHGRDDAIEEGRRAMQDTMRVTCVTTIERLTGRSVRSFMSANDPANELQSEIFVLDSEPVVDLEHAELEERARTARERNKEMREELRALRAEQAQTRSALHRHRHDDG